MPVGYASRIESLDLSGGLKDWPAPLKMRESGHWATWYAPFDHVNTNARIVIVGITPGLQQAGNALKAYQSARRAGRSHEQALDSAKVFASFSGPMRANLVAMLDFIGIADLLSIDSCSELFAGRSDLVHFTSALRYPVTRHGRNYTGTPQIIANEYTRRDLEGWFTQEAATLKKALFVPLGPSVTGALMMLASRGILDPAKVLAGLPHPSRSNGERIAYFLQRKSRDALSRQVDPDRFDAARVALMRQVSALRSAGAV